MSFRGVGRFFSSTLEVVAPNQSEMAAVLGLFDVMKDLGKRLGFRAKMDGVFLSFFLGDISCQTCMSF